MRLCLIAAILLATVWPAANLAAEFPFEGYIAVDRADVASGPGRRFYTTDKLPRGTKVEVYREDDAGWLAIRPPEGSFSWIPGEYIERLDDGVGKVRAASESWIGTSVEQIKEHKSQVELKPGELVEIIDEKTVAAAAGTEQWLKIAPPAGEFRYVHSRDVSREIVEPIASDEQSPEPDEDEPAAEAESPVEPRPFRPSTSAVALRDIDEVRSKLAAMRSDLAELAGPDVQPAQYKATVGRELSPDGFVPRKRRPVEPFRPVPAPAANFTRGQTPSPARPRLDLSSRVADARPAAPIASSPISSLPAGDSLDRQLEAIDTELSLMLAQDKSTWNLAGLREQVQRLVESGATPADRGRARLLLDKISQFETTFAVGEQGLLATSAAASDEPAGDSPYAPRYDAQGWLKPVISRTKAAAPYAVVDADGKPLCFVTPSPGLNVGRYVNKQVGLYGKRGYIETLKTPHVMAERVIDLDRHVR